MLTPVLAAAFLAGRESTRLAGVPFLAELIRYQLEEHAGGWHLQFDFDAAAFSPLLNQRLGRTVLLTNRMDWSTEQGVAGYAGQQSIIERVFRGPKAGDWLGCEAMHHWTDRKIRIHAFYCMLGISDGAHRLRTLPADPDPTGLSEGSRSGTIAP
jgi:hypothetical protein